MSELRVMGGDVEGAMEHIGIPSYVIDTSGVIRWTNDAAKRVAGDVCGRQFTSLVAAEDVRRARENFARKLLGTAKVTDATFVLVADDGTRTTVEVSSVPLLR